MKSMYIKSTAVIAMAILLTLGMNAQPRNGRGYGQGEGPGQGPCMTGTPRAAGAFACLDLSEEQQTQLQEIRTAHHKTMKPLRNQQEELRLKKRHLMSEDQVDLKAVNKIIDQQTGLSAEIQKLNAANRVEARSILTEEQRMIMDQQRMRPKGRRGNARAGMGAGRNAGRNAGQGAAWRPAYRQSI